MPDGWQTWKDSDLQKLADAVSRMLNHGTVTQTREIAADCVGGVPSKADSIVVNYAVPATAMAVFPTTGTKKRDLLIAVMSDSVRSRCWSARYSVQSKMGISAGRLLTFLTVTTDPGTALVGVDRQVGRWTSWTIKTNGGDSFQLVNTETGAFVSCGHEHFKDTAQIKVTHAFINCGTADSIAKLAVEQVKATGGGRSAVAAAFDNLMLAYRDGKREGSARDDRITESAWGRCGNLGCCAAE